MNFKKLALALGASAVIAAPTIAQATDSVDAARTGAQIVDSEQLTGGSGLLIALLAAAAIIAGIIIIADGGDEDTLPVSP